MKKKQVIGLAAAVLAFAFLCSVSMLVRSRIRQKSQSVGQTLSNVLSEIDAEYYPTQEEYIGVLRIEGTIQDTSGSSAVLSGSSYDHQMVLDSIAEMENAPNNRGIFLYLNSGGGTVYESDEVYLRLLEYKQTTGRPVWAYCGSQTCSGAYYIACAADRIIANRNTWTGSIGVIIQLTNLQGLYEKFGIEEIDITSGANKAMGSAGSELTQQQREILQSLVDEAYQQFVSIVAQGRSLGVEEVKSLADGRIYSAQQALSLKLVDEIAGFEDTQQAMSDSLGGALLLEADRGAMGLFSQLFSWYSAQTPKSDAQILSDYLQTSGRGELLYYAG